MSLTRNWMAVDNLGQSEVSRARRARQRALDTCVMTACFYEPRRKVVGAGFERAKAHLSPDELAALQTITTFPCPPLTHPTSNPPA